MKKLILFVSFIFISSNSLAGFTSGNELQQWLSISENKKQPDFNSGLYKGYVSGVIDVGNKYAFCLSTGVTRGQAIAVVSKYIKNNPEKWNKGAASLVIKGLKKAFPCTKT
ncbi:Rap1a/Tai family immunity protein [Colwellia psychrerythraea]|uniref:Rap1a immunity protein domain-containing protein n=1 Tax=Colwellia psychrerythraea (strain 34H / ATCC BAA-681) TaxID=167879 RepID=Q485A3_COLP3|nr:Rap1a/Tai family immunity protein [Colwellia psychrerythraea]AAZ27409.1 hypothetical protein CPS_1624 [Colwellia psychrerythraea 34H]